MSAALSVDARNRGVRSLLVGLALDVAVGVALVLSAFVLDLTSWGQVQWTVLSFSLAKSVVQAVCAFVLRRFLDPSRVPTPLPPTPQPEPAEPSNVRMAWQPREDGALDWTAAVWVAAVCLVLLVLFAVFGTPTVR